MLNHSKLNMFGGTISENTATNNSTVQTCTGVDTKSIATTQRVDGVGIYANNSEVNLTGGEISDNTALNNATTKLVDNTGIKSLNDGIYGVGLYVENSNLNIQNSFSINGNKSDVNSVINFGKNAQISSNSSSGIRGLQGYIRNTIVTIDGLNIDGTNSTFSNDTNRENNALINIANNGGGLMFNNCSNMNIECLNINKCNSENGGALFVISCSGTISNSLFGEKPDEGNTSTGDNAKNTATESGGALYIESSNIDIKDSNFFLNKAKFGGAIYSKSSITRLENVTVSNNKSTGSGGGLYSSMGKMIFSGDNTEITNNTAGTFGGGIAINSSEVYMNDGNLGCKEPVQNQDQYKNTAGTYGYGVGIHSGAFIQNAGTINNGIGINADNDSKFIRYGGVFSSKVGKSNGDKIDNPDGTYYIDKMHYSGKEFRKLEVTTLPTKTVFLKGENFDKTGMKVTATYSDGSTKEITGYTVADGNNLAIGKKTVTISYTESGITKTTTQSIKVIELTKINVTTQPIKTSYIEGQNFDRTGMKITATYIDGSSNESKRILTYYNVTDGNNLSVGKETVTISYTENGVTKTTTQSITVTEKLQINFNDYIEVDDEGNKYIENISPSTTLEEMIDNVKTNGTITIFKNNEIISDNNEKISTGMKVKISLKNENYEFTIAVKGDTNGDGEADLKDLLQINKHRLNKVLLENEYLLAGDVNKDNEVNLKDLLQINKFRLGKIETL